MPGAQRSPWSKTHYKKPCSPVVETLYDPSMLIVYGVATIARKIYFGARTQVPEFGLSFGACESKSALGGPPESKCPIEGISTP